MPQYEKKTKVIPLKALYKSLGIPDYIRNLKLVAYVNGAVITWEQPEKLPCPPCPPCPPSDENEIETK